MADMAASVTLRLIDKLVGPLQKTRRSISDLKHDFEGLNAKAGALAGGNLKSRHNQLIASARNLAGVVRGQAQDLLRINREEERRIGIMRKAAGVAAGLVAARGLTSSVSKAADLETTFTDAELKTDLDRGQMDAYRARIRHLAADLKSSTGEAASAFDDLLGRGMDPDAAMATLEPSIKVAKAYRAEMLAVAGTAKAVSDQFNIPIEEAGRSLAIMVQGGKEGSFEMKEMARYAPSLSAAFKQLGPTGKQGLAWMTAGLQVIRKGAGTSEEAAVRLSDLSLKAYSPDVIKNYKKQGIDIRAAIESGISQGVNPLETIASESRKILAANPDANLFGDKEAKLALFALMDYGEDLKAIEERAFAAGTGGNMIDKDFDRRMEDTNAKIEAFLAATERLQTAIGTSLQPAFNTLLGIVTPVVEGIAGLAGDFPGVASGVTGVVAAIGAYKAGKFALDLLGISSAVRGLRAGVLMETAAGLDSFADAQAKMGASNPEAFVNSTKGVQRLAGVKNPGKLAVIGRGLGTISKGMLGLVGGPLGALFLVGSIVASLVLSSDSAAKAAESHQAALEKLGVTANSTAKDLAALSEQQKADALFELSGMQATQRKDKAEREKQVAKFGAQSTNARNRTAPEKLFLTRLGLKSRDTSGQEAGRELFSAYRDYRSDKITAGDVRAKITELVHRDESLRDKFTPLFDALANLNEASEALNKTQDQIDFITGKRAPEAVNTKADSPAELRSNYAAQMSASMADFEALKQDHGLDAAAPVSSSQPSVLSNYGLGGGGTAAEAQSETIVNEIAPVKNVSVSVTINANGYGASEVAALISQKLNGELSRALSDGGSES